MASPSNRASLAQIVQLILVLATGIAMAYSGYLFLGESLVDIGLNDLSESPLACLSLVSSAFLLVGGGMSISKRRHESWVLLIGVGLGWLYCGLIFLFVPIVLFTFQLPRVLLLFFVPCLLLSITTVSTLRVVIAR